MKKQVILTAKDVHSDKLTAHERNYFSLKYQTNIDALKEMREIYPEKKRYCNDNIKFLQQEMYREMLEMTRPRINRKDVKGNPILTPDMYLKKLAEVKTPEEKEELDRTHVSKVVIDPLGESRVIMVDASLAETIQTLVDHGYRTGQSCSGILADHPNYRYVQDDKHGRFVNGECIHFNKQGSGAYLTFWKPEAAYEDSRCTAEQIEDIRRIAEEQGWVVEDMDIFFQPSIRLGLPLTYDGTGKREILHEANALTDQQNPGLYDSDFLQWLEKRTPNEIEVEKWHDGVVLWTDEMILQRWNKLAQGLVNAQKQREHMSRISDEHIFVGGDGYWRIKCKIDGQNQLSERLSDYKLSQINEGIIDMKRAAAEIYEDKFETLQQQAVQKGRSV